MNEAMSDGNPTASEWKEPSDETWMKVLDGMPETYLTAISDPTKSNKIDLCNGMIKMYDNLSNLSELERVTMAKYIFLSD